MRSGVWAERFRRSVNQNWWGQNGYEDDCHSIPTNLAEEDGKKAIVERAHSREKKGIILQIFPHGSTGATEYKFVVLASGKQVPVRHAPLQKRYQRVVSCSSFSRMRQSVLLSVSAREFWLTGIYVAWRAI